MPLPCLLKNYINTNLTEKKKLSRANSKNKQSYKIADKLKNLIFYLVVN